VASDVVVVMAPGTAPDLPGDVQVAYDAVGGEGPLMGLVAGLAAARHEVVVVVGGDMPWIRADVVQALTATLGADRAIAALASDGRTQPLPIALRRDPVLSAARRLVESGERRLGALLDALDVAVIAEDQWRALDPGADTLRDIDVVDDLPPGA